VGGKKDVSEAVNVELVEIIFGEVQLETAVEVLDASFKLFPVKSRD
jgi:hypothetical protein